MTAALDGSDVRSLARSAAGYHRYPRWSPDGQWIAFVRGDGVRDDIFVVSTRGGEPRPLTHDRNMMSGLAWLPDSSGIIYGSSRGSTLPYLPPWGLWEMRLNGQAPRAVTPTDVSYEQPDVHDTGLVAAVRMRMRLDVWKFPFGRVATDNVRDGVGGHPPDRPRADTDRRAGWRSGRVPVRQRRPQQPLGDFDAQRRASPGDVRGRCGGVGWRAGVVSGRKLDRVRLVEGQHRPRLRRVGRQPGRQQSSKPRDVGTRHRVVARRQVSLLCRQGGGEN